MSGTMPEARRIQPTDCLYALYVDLAAQGRTIRLYDADAWASWTAGCADVLAAVPDEMQRRAWALVLAQAVPLVGCSRQDVFDTLLALAEGVRRCRP